MTRVLTSRDSPIRVDWLPADRLPGLAGGVGLTPAPGKRTVTSGGLRWERDLGEDLDRLVGLYQVGLLVCLLEDHELEDMGIPDLVGEAVGRGVRVLRLPIPDFGVPPGFESVEELVGRIIAAARAGTTVVVHCAGGIGRTGTIAGCVLVEHGSSAEEAIGTLHRVRGVRSPETPEQERFISGYERRKRARAGRSAPPASTT